MDVFATPSGGILCYRYLNNRKYNAMNSTKSHFIAKYNQCKWQTTIQLISTNTDSQNTQYELGRPGPVDNSVHLYLSRSNFPCFSIYKTTNIWWMFTLILPISFPGDDIHKWKTWKQFYQMFTMNSRHTFNNCSYLRWNFFQIHQKNINFISNICFYVYFDIRLLFTLI